MILKVAHQITKAGGPEVQKAVEKIIKKEEVKRMNEKVKLYLFRYGFPLLMLGIALAAKFVSFNGAGGHPVWV